MPTVVAIHLHSRFNQEILIIKKGTGILLFILIIVKRHQIFITKFYFAN